MAKITGSAVVNTFRQYEYVRYTWGGNSPETGWDCSGAVNWIVGFKYHMDIPGFGGGTYGPGSGHGPVVADWINWVGVGHGAFPRTRPNPGDIIAWAPNQHMGMAINATRFVSAANPSIGTVEADIATFFPWEPFVLRLMELAVGPVAPSEPAPPGPGADDYSLSIFRAVNEFRGGSRKVSGYADALREFTRNR